MEDCITPIICCPMGDSDGDTSSEPATWTLPSSSLVANNKEEEESLSPPPSGLLPILIIPGFMSSGLEIKESKLCPSWKDKRIWLNLSSLGLSSLYFGQAQKKKQSIKITKSTTTCSNNEQQQQQQQQKYKSAWLEHMRLNLDDMRSEPNGVQIRPISGLEGVDYLTPGNAFTSHVSYVFGPMILALQKEGYVQGNTLQAAPYDWRLPPSELERRDGYFTKTIQCVQDLYQKNNGTPVVLLAHSLGCKTAHYFLNFCKLHQGGQAWIDKHIHTYLPVGAPHLGAPKALRSTIAGDKMSLDAFLNDEEALILGRSFGSGPWLFPRELPPGVPSSVHILPHGILEVSFDYSLSAHDLVHKRRDISKPNRYQLIVQYSGSNNQKVVCTPFRRVSSSDQPHSVFFPDKISFVTDAQIQNGECQLCFFLQEPGIAHAKHEKPDPACNPLTCLLKFLFCCCLCDLIYKLIRWLICGVFQSVLLSADAITGAVGGGTNLAFSEILVLPKQVLDGDTVEIKVPLHHKDDYGKTTTMDWFSCFFPKVARISYLTIRVKWIPFNKEKSFRPICSPITRPDPDSEPLHLYKRKEEYQEFSGYDIIEREGLNNTLQMIKDVYDGDNPLLGPRTNSSSDPPPVKRVHAIYGINLPTEIGAIYKRKDCCLSEEKLKNLYKLDKKATVDSKTGYLIKDGLLMETPKTSQKVASDRHVCGDGTVPYWSLQHCKTWASGEREVTVVELEKAEHREILADSRFHKALLDYCRRPDNSKIPI